MEFSDIKVSCAQEEDSDGILFVQNENLLSQKSPEEHARPDVIARQGFLIHGLDQDELRCAIKDQENHIVFVAKSGNRVVGYFLGYDLMIWIYKKALWPASIQLDHDSDDIFTSKTLYGRHVARLSQYSGKYIGRILEEKVFEEGRNRGYTQIIVEILEKPIPNLVSVFFHQKIGYKRIGKVPEGSEMMWGLWKKNF